ncbi:MAG: Nif11-like leader peptide family RiPP precursor [Deferribacterales bacterium]
MSSESFQSFIQAISGDVEATARFKECILKGRESVVAYAHELGYEIDADDLEILYEKFKQSVKDVIETSEADESEGMKNLKSFMRFSGGNEDVKRRLAELGFGDPQAVVNYAKELGYEFSEKDLDEFSKQLLDKSEELSDEDLEKVAGGFLLLSLALTALVGVVSMAIAAVSGAAVGAAVAIAVTSAK